MEFEKIDIIEQQLRESAELKLLMQNQAETVQQVAYALESCLRSGGKIMLFGNGGSAGDAQHIAGELIGKFRIHREALPAMALTTNSSILTAIANDYDFNTIFCRQLEAWVKPGDVVIGISTSGKSPNVIEGFHLAREKGAIVVGLCGRDTQQMENVVDYCISVPSDDTPRIQEVHITIGHIICDILEQSYLS